MVSFMIRPLSNQYQKWVAKTANSSTAKNLRGSLSAAKSNIMYQVLPLTIKQQYNTHHPYGWNDGSMIQARGYQTQISLGIFSKIGPLEIQLQPELVYAQNNNFETFPTRYNDSIWRSHYSILNGIDNPEKYGNGSFKKVYAGQSSVKLRFKKVAMGVSTENLWWGPGTRNSLIMSNNAPGFPHITLNTSSPVTTGIGSFEGQIISGVLKGSGILPDTNRTINNKRLYVSKADQKRYLNGMIVTWQPKWTSGLFIGLARVFYIDKDDIKPSANGYVPVLTAFFKNKTPREDQLNRDQLLSLFMRLVSAGGKQELYAEFGRNDHAQDGTDLLLEPEHARAYTIGFKKIFTPKPAQQLELMAELTHLQMSSTASLRDAVSWYTHHRVPHGYTNFGQVIGAGIGPGGSSQAIGLSRVKGVDKVGLMLERVVRNNDFYYEAFTLRRNYTAHWVDLSMNLNKSWTRNRFIYVANLSLIRSLNYQWRYNNLYGKRDVNHINANFSFSYLL